MGLRNTEHHGCNTDDGNGNRIHISLCSSSAARYFTSAGIIYYASTTIFAHSIGRYNWIQDTLGLNAQSKTPNFRLGSTSARWADRHAQDVLNGRQPATTRHWWGVAIDRLNPQHLAVISAGFWLALRPRNQHCCYSCYYLAGTDCIDQSTLITERGGRNADRRPPPFLSFRLFVLIKCCIYRYYALRY